MKKGKEETFTTIPVGKIVSESNRKHGGIGNIEILAESIKAGGLINPPTVVASEDGTYRVVAGRRRVEAVRRLKWEEVAVRVIDGADAGRLEAVALSENVNRLETHPLDEAEDFKRLLDKGADIKDVAALYDRSISGVRHRVRLCNLQEEMKEMFREGKIKLSGAALLAGLPAEDQAKFAKKYGERPSVSNWDIYSFVRQAQRRVVAWIADARCEKCESRTHNAEPGLFEEFDGLKDVCFDQDCYAGKWKKLIEGLIAQQENILQTENNIIFDREIPDFLPKKTKAVALGEVEYNVLPHKKHTWGETSKKAKKGTAWLVAAQRGSTDAKVRRVAYKAYERPDYSCHYATPDPVEDFLIDQAPDVAIEERKAAAERAKAKYGNSWRFKNGVRSAVLSAVVFRRLKMESRENMAAAYLEDKYSGYDENTGEYREFYDDFDRDVFAVIFGPAGVTKISDVPKEPLIERLFLFLAATGFKTSDLPDLKDGGEEWKEAEKSFFWKFARMSREEYIAMYRDILGAAIRAAGPNQGEAGE
jgi:ParB/RepB/Spo0J family partition protein